MVFPKSRSIRFLKLSFALRAALETNPFQAMALFLSCLLFVAACSTYMYANQELQSVLSDAQDLKQFPIANKKIAEPPAGHQLPKFEGSSLIKALQEAASVADLSINEVRFTLDTPAGHPFERYRANFGTSGNYPAIRKFISHLLTNSNGLVLDTVSCTRRDIQMLDVTCEFGVYLPYQQGQHG